MDTEKPFSVHFLIAVIDSMCSDYPERFPCKIQLPLDCYCNSGVTSQCGSETPAYHARLLAVGARVPASAGI